MLRIENNNGDELFRIEDNGEITTKDGVKLSELSEEEAWAKMNEVTKVKETLGEGEK